MCYQSCAKKINRERERETFWSASSLLALYYRSKLKLFVCASLSVSLSLSPWMCACKKKKTHMKREHIYHSNNLQYKKQIVSARQKYTKQIFSLFCSQTKGVLECLLATFWRYSFNIKEWREINQRTGESSTGKAGISHSATNLVCNLIVSQ